jgi:hypothetical protein
MNRWLDSCAGFRKCACLLANEALPETDRAEILGHLAACPNCRAYQDQIANLTAVLAMLPKKFANLEPGPDASARWARDFALATEQDRSSSKRTFGGILDWCWDMFWPARHIWVGLAAAWLVILILNSSQPNFAQVETAKNSSPSAEFVRAYLDHENLGRGSSRPTKPVHAPLKPNSPPPRGQRLRKEILG